MRAFLCLRCPTKIQRGFRRNQINLMLFTVSGGLLLLLYYKLSDTVVAESSFKQHYVDFKRNQRVKYVKNVGNLSSACRLPSLDPFHPSIMQFVTDLGKLRCEGKTYSTYAHNILDVKGEDISSVQYRIIERAPGDDFHTVLSEPKHVVNQAKILNQKPSKPGKIWFILITTFNEVKFYFTSGWKSICHLRWFSYAVLNFFSYNATYHKAQAGDKTE